MCIAGNGIWMCCFWLAQRVLWVAKKLISVWALLPWMAGILFCGARTRNENLMARLTWLRQILLQGDCQLPCLLLHWWREIFPCFLWRPCRATGKGHCSSIVSCGTLGTEMAAKHSSSKHAFSKCSSVSLISACWFSGKKMVWKVLLRSRWSFQLCPKYVYYTHNNAKLWQAIGNEWKHLQVNIYSYCFLHVWKWLTQVVLNSGHAENLPRPAPWEASKRHC